MKLRHIITSVIALTILSATTNLSYAADFAEHSVLASGTWKKIAVNESGVCKITYDQLRGMGFSHPELVQVYGYGGKQLAENFALPKIDDLNKTPMFESGSAIYFYAQGVRKWNYRGMSSDHWFDISSNVYATQGYYFLTERNDGKNLIPMAELVEEDTDETEIDTYMEHVYHKTENVNPSRSGRGWLGDQTMVGKAFSTNFKIKDIDMSQNAYMYVSLATASNYSNKCEVIVNNDTAHITFTSSVGHVSASGGKKTMKLKPTQETFPVSITLNAQSDADKFWVEQIVCYAFKQLKFDGNTMYFRNPYTDTPDIYKYNIESADKDLIVWDITNPQDIQQIPTSEENGRVTFRRYPVQMEEFVAFKPNSSDFVKAELVGDVKNQDLHAYKGYDAIIITAPEFKSEAQRLADIHAQHDNIATLITTQEEIFNEFSSGTPDASAIRWFLKMFYDRGETQKSVILFGDGSFDNRNVMKNINNNNIILTYQSGALYDESRSYVTDDYYCFLSDNNNNSRNDRMKMDYSIGRFPVSTLDQATNMVNKVEKYLSNQQFGSWKNKVCLIADDNEGSDEASTVNKFYVYSDNIGKIIHAKDPSMEIQKIHSDAYTRVSGSNGTRYPEAEAEITKAVENGVLVVNYIGHSSELAWAAERLFTQNQAATIFNDKQGFWFTASCQFAMFDNFARSGGEDLVMNPNGGALTLFSAARTVYDDKNDNMNRTYIGNMFSRDENGEPFSIGEICRRSKVALPNDSNKMSYMLLGDPLLKIKYPQGDVTTDSIEILDDETSDTLRALSAVRVYGHIEDAMGQRLDQFNGIVNITLYDKESKMYTKANSLSEEKKMNGRHAYYDRLNVLFSGKAEVKDGEFKTVFMIPKDINYNFGSGRLYYYAYDEELGYDADGSNEDIIIGGSNKKEIVDSCGPDIKLYMNYKGFRSGNKVNKTPVLYAEISDINGINTSGGGIGHDITLVKVGEENSPTILNKYFSYNMDSYSDGLLTYQFPTLDTGHYTVKIKAWDLVNNSSVESIEFYVDEDNQERIHIHNISVIPSIASESATIQITHDRPFTIASYKIRIFNQLGAEVYTTDLIQERIPQDMEWTWNLQGKNGSTVNDGIYLVRVEFETPDGDWNGLTGKMIVKTPR